MRFHLLDRLETLTDERAVGVKAVTQAEEYLGDHFPTFPVLPGVLMLEAATQAAAWVVFRRGGLAGPAPYAGPTLVVLKAARNVRYGHFVSPGRRLRVTADFVKDLGNGVSSFKVEGTVDTDSGERTAFTGKLELAAGRMADRGRDDLDAKLTASLLDRFANLGEVPALIPSAVA